MGSKTEWKEVARRGASHPLLVVDGVMEGFLSGRWGRAHRVRWNPAHYRQFDRARWFSQQDYERYRETLRLGEQRRPGYLLALAKEYQRRIAAHHSFAERHGGSDFSKQTGAQLRRAFIGWFARMSDCWCFAYDYIFINSFLPDEVVSAVARREPDLATQNQYYRVLLAADAPSEQWREKVALLETARYLRQRRLPVTSASVTQRLDAHVRRYAHLGYYYFRGQPHTVETVRQRLREFVSLPPKRLRQLTDDVRQQRNNPFATRRLMRALRLDAGTRRSVTIIKRWAALSNYVDETYGYAVHQLRPLWMEIGKRIGLRNPLELSFLLHTEIEAYLRRGRPSPHARSVVRERMRDHALLLTGKKIRVLTGGALAHYQRSEQRRRTVHKMIKVLRGQAAAPGYARGRVTVVYSIHDLDKVNRGDIMVTDATNPTYVPAMERAAAIVTDEGGLLSHAAIVSRELGIPCVVGSKVGTTVLRTGDRVEVDAHKGIVKKL